jgi:hypothetical protein
MDHSLGPKRGPEKGLDFSPQKDRISIRNSSRPSSMVDSLFGDVKVKPGTATRQLLQIIALFFVHPMLTASRAAAIYTTPQSI